MNIVNDVIEKTAGKPTGLAKIIHMLPFVNIRLDVNFSDEHNESELVARFIGLLKHYKDQGLGSADVVDLLEKQLKKKKYVIDCVPKMVYKYWKSV